MMCLHKHDEYVDFTKYGDPWKYRAVMICIECGGDRYEYWGVPWPTTTGTKI